MKDPDAARPAVRELVERCLDALETAGPAGVDRVLAPHPELAEAVRRRLDALSESGLLGDDEPVDLPEQLGDFRLLRKLGEGGMGVVYLAEQRSLGRQVALKLLQPERLRFGEARQRFRREAESIARLEHAHIVQVHAVGEARGVPYLAMELVRGATLAEVLRAIRSHGAGPVDARAVGSTVAERAGGLASGYEGSWSDLWFRVAREIASALAHAHERGILHRDVKPSNIMLAADGRARLLDFGLALDAETDERTKTGVAVGSVPYMAPEQIRGARDEVDERTDVYGLGVTLYEALSLRPAFWHDSEEATRRAILAPTWRPIRDAGREVPWEAEVVCRTAMAPEPAHRYPSAAAFAADLDNHLARRTITARRPSAALSLRRLLQRQPTRVALGALVVIGLGAAASIHLLRERAVSTEAVAEDRLAAAIRAVDTLLEQGSDSALAGRPGTDPVRKQLLERAVSLYRDLLAQAGDSELLGLRVATAQVRLGDLQCELGRYDESADAFRQALERVTAWRRDEPDAQAPVVVYARAQIGMALIDRARGQAAELRSRLEALIDELEPRIETVGPALERPVGVAWQMLANEALGRGDIETAERCLTAARAELPQNEDDTPLSLARRASLERNLGYAIGFYRRESEPWDRFDRAIALHSRLVELHGDTPQRRFQLARTHAACGHVAAARRDTDRAVEHTRPALDLVRTLATEYPDRADYADGLLQFSYQFAVAEQRAGRREAAAATCRSALEASDDFDDRFPQSVTLVRRRAYLATQLATLCAAAGQLDEAARLWADVDALWARLLVQKPDDAMIRAESAVSLDNRARFEQSRGGLDAARTFATIALERHRTARRALPGRPELRVRIGKTSTLLAAVLTALDDPDAAIDVLEAALADGGLTAEDLDAPGNVPTTLRGHARFRKLLDR